MFVDKYTPFPLQIHSAGIFLYPKKALNVTEYIQVAPNLLLSEIPNILEKTGDAENTKTNYLKSPSKKQPQCKNATCTLQYTKYHKRRSDQCAKWVLLIISVQWHETNIQKTWNSPSKTFRVMLSKVQNKNTAVAKYTPICRMHGKTRHTAEFTVSVNLNSAGDGPLSSAWPGCFPH